MAGEGETFSITEDETWALLAGSSSWRKLRLTCCLEGKGVADAAQLHGLSRSRHKIEGTYLELSQQKEVIDTSGSSMEEAHSMVAMMHKGSLLKEVPNAKKLARGQQHHGGSCQDTG